MLGGGVLDMYEGAPIFFPCQGRQLPDSPPPVSYLLSRAVHAAYVQYGAHPFLPPVLYYYFCMLREAVLARIGFLHLVGQKLRQAAQPGGVFSLPALGPLQEGSAHWTAHQDCECKGLGG